mmetsp:Transcript_36993/g.58487  ORF Transcript_36993/g.58487 Transcript_36993/m.58487 type:complete len:424 (-) Transcript_36993:562-1833(-)
MVQGVQPHLRVRIRLLIQPGGSHNLFALALAALAFLLTGEAHLNLLCLPFATIIVGGVLIEQRRAEDPHIPILFGEVVHRTETHHTNLLMPRGPDLQWKTQDVANAWNLDVDGFREDVAAGRDLQGVLIALGIGHVKLDLWHLLVQVHLLNPRSAVFQQQLQRHGRRKREFSFFSAPWPSLLLLFAGACFRDHRVRFSSDIGAVFLASFFADDIGYGLGINRPGLVEDVGLIHQGRLFGRAACHDLCHHIHEVITIRLGQVQSSRRAFDLDAIALHLFDLSLQVLVGVLASLPVVAQILVEAGDLLFRAHHQRGAGVRDDATGGLHLWLLEGWVAATHLQGLISNGDAMEIHGPMSLPHGGQRLWMLSSVHAQDAVCPVIEANGEMSHLGGVEKTWNGQAFGLPGAWLELRIGPAQAQNSLEV